MHLNAEFQRIERRDKKAFPNDQCKEIEENLEWERQGISSRKSVIPKEHFMQVPFSSVQSLSCVLLFATPRTAAHQACLSITNFQSPPKPMSILLVMPFNHLILCCPLLQLPSIFPSIRVFSNESALCIRWPKYWTFSFNIHPSNGHPD